MNEMGMKFSRLQCRFPARARAPGPQIKMTGVPIEPFGVKKQFFKIIIVRVERRYSVIMVQVWEQSRRQLIIN